MSGISFAEVFSRAVLDRGLTLERLHERLKQAGVPVSVATLSYWRSGRSQPERRGSLKALPVLEGVLGLPPGHLIRHLPRPRPRARAAASPGTPSPGMAGVLPAGEIVQGIIAGWDIDMSSRLTRLSIQDRMAITAEGTDGTINTRQVLRADADGVRSLPVSYLQDVEGPDGSEFLPPLDEDGLVGEATEVGIVPLTACSIGRLVRKPEINLLVAELVFPRPLAKGEVIVTEHLLIPRPTTVPSDRIQRGVSRPLRELVLEAHFDPGMLPVRAHRFVRETADGPEIEVREIPVHGSSVQTIFLDLRSGTAGLRWEWP